MGHFSKSFPQWKDTHFDKVIKMSPFTHTHLQLILSDMLQSLS